MEIALITRIKELNEEQVPKLISWLEPFQKLATKIYIICDELSESKLSSLKNDKIELIVCKGDPTGPTSPNLAIEKLSEGKIDAFMIVSKEVNISNADIELLRTTIQSDSNLLATGYRFKIKLKDEETIDGPVVTKLNNELNDYYDDVFIAYKVPWNTCVIWNSELFKKHVGKFDEITENKSGRELNVCIDNVCYSTKHQGMEDGLAIAKATFNNSDIKYKLIEKETLTWEIDKTKITEHRKKLARKETVMRNFMKEKGYSEVGLLKGAS